MESETGDPKFDQLNKITDIALGIAEEKTRECNRLIAANDLLTGAIKEMTKAMIDGNRLYAQSVGATAIKVSLK